MCIEKEGKREREREKEEEEEEQGGRGRDVERAWTLWSENWPCICTLLSRASPSRTPPRPDSKSEHK
jgi:hypothetical protein